MSLPCAYTHTHTGFIDVIVAPAYEVCGDVMETILKELIQKNSQKEKIDWEGLRTWSDHITNNRSKWKHAAMQV